MSISPDNIELSAEQKRQLARISEQTGKSWQALLDEALSRLTPRTAEDSNGDTVLDRLTRFGLLGCITDAPEDLSTNPKYMEGFGGSGR
jgi:hypothetical protein